MSKTGRPAMERFINKIERQPDGCWQWVSTLHVSGYGQFLDEGKMWYAHRWAYEHIVGPVPDGLELDHLCRNRACTNPQHLEAVTREVNMRRGLLPNMVTFVTNVCPRGHDMADAYIVHRPDGKTNRQCRPCAKARSARYKAATR